MSGIGGLLTIGSNALRSSQIAINVTGNNIANVDTIGYSRQTVRFQEAKPFDTNSGQIGGGSYAEEIQRNFNRFLENAFLDQNSQANMWNEQAVIMTSVENIFNESNSAGVHNQMSLFFDSWSTLSTMSDNTPAREALLSQSHNMAMLIQDSMNSMANMKEEMNLYIKQNVDIVNDLVDQIADVNKEIAEHHNPPHNSANSLLDKRDSLVRDLGTLVDVSVQDNGPKDFNIYLKEGMPLVEGNSKYYLETAAPFYENDTKNFTGNLHFEGEDHHEYTFEFTDSTNFKVSIDGGKTWVTDQKGMSTFAVPPVGEKVQIGDLKISFDGGGYRTGETPKFEEGDKFYIIPKESIKWHKPTTDAINVSKTINMESIGGKLGAYVSSRDSAIAEYEDKLNALTESLIWEVNRAHSQGTGLSAFTKNIGTTTVDDPNLALGSPWQNIAYADRLTEGNLNMYFTTDEGATITAGELNFNTDPTGGQENFDPEKHSLQDLVAAINRSYKDADGNQLISATIEGGQIQLVAKEGVNYRMGSDTTGLWAALGVNTFFAGDNANNIEVNPHIVNNPEYVNAQSMDGQGEGNEGDGSIASAIAGLATAGVQITTTWETTNESILDYYAGLVGLVGADTRNAIFNADYYATLAIELGNQALSTSGVNLDEEMLLLIKFQHSYTAAAKLITTADEMFQTLLGLKP